LNLLGIFTDALAFDMTAAAKPSFFSTLHMMMSFFAFAWILVILSDQAGLGTSIVTFMGIDKDVPEAEEEKLSPIQKQPRRFFK
jgi:hypothetical protein